jgi:hypothetical protein
MIAPVPTVQPGSELPSSGSWELDTCPIHRIPNDYAGSARFRREREQMQKNPMIPPVPAVPPLGGRTASDGQHATGPRAPLALRATAIPVAAWLARREPSMQAMGPPPGGLVSPDEGFGAGDGTRHGSLADRPKKTCSLVTCRPDGGPR